MTVFLVRALRQKLELGQRVGLSDFTKEVF